MMSRNTNQLAKTQGVDSRKSGTLAWKALARRIPLRLRVELKRLLLLPWDGVDLLFGRRKDLVPSRYYNRFVGDGDFVAVGDEFLKYFVDLGGLRPTHRVLDVGSGIGRMARGLTKYLASGSYEGIDIVPQGIDWCRRNVSQRYPHFRFHLADVRNLMYNPRGRFEAAEYRFPFGDADFDFTYLTSVFTHMRKREMEHYLLEITRTLRPDGRCLVTYFLLNKESRALIEDGRSSLEFKYALDGCWTKDEDVPETAIAFDEEYIRKLYYDLGFTVETVRYGSWCGRPEYLSYQDIAVARRRP
jgi:ubiquinone/menaquinone biosynthesis C-methylase UbiE